MLGFFFGDENGEKVRCIELRKKEKKERKEGHNKEKQGRQSLERWKGKGGYFLCHSAMSAICHSPQSIILT